VNPLNNFYKNNRRYRKMKKYKCSICGNVYDPEVGDPKGGIPPGTPFEELPDSWRCPRCGNPKNVYYPEED